MVPEFFWEMNMIILEKRKSTFNQFIQMILLQFDWSQSIGYELSPAPNWQGLNFTSDPLLTPHEQKQMPLRPELQWTLLH